MPLAASLAETPTAVGDGEGEVDIVAWPGYIERGETDKNYDWVTAFEKETGCKVNVKTAATSDEMVTAAVNQGAKLDASHRLGRRGTDGAEPDERGVADQVEQ